MDFANYWFSSGAGGGAGYEIDQSLRFDGSAYLSRTPSSAGNRKTWTWSGWVKRSKLGTYQAILGGYTSATFDFTIGFADTDGLRFYSYNSGLQASLLSNDKFRDPSAWYHIVYAVDTTQGTSSDRVKIYVNNRQVTSFSTATYPGSSVDLSFNTTNTQRIGQTGYPSMYFDGYLAEVNFIDGSALDPTDFGEFDDNGVWRPITYGGSYGTNGFYLKFDPSATNGIGHDHSGNGNNWTASGFTTTGDRTDVVTDTPTDNHCTLNPIEETEPGYESDFVFSEGNLKIAFPSSPPTDHVCGTLFSTGAWYAEIECISVTRYANVNVLEPEAMGFVGSRPGKRTNPASGYSYSNSGTITHNNIEYTGAASWTAGDVIGVACNVDGNSLRFYKNGTLQYTFTTTRTEPMTIGCDGTDGSGNSSSFFINCGQQPYQYTPPTGFTALSTKNIPAPAIANPATAFDLVTYEGTGTTNTLTVDFSSNFAWIKRYDGTGNNILVDTLRGTTPPARLFSDSSVGENNASDGVNSFSSTGVVLDGTGGGGGDVNQTSRFYWAAQWDGNGTGTSNTAGSITSTVSANPTAGFSIVGYSGGSTGSTVGHGLGVAPEMIIVKNRDSSTDWMVWLDGFASNQGLNLNNADGKFSSGSNTFIYDVTSTTFKIGSSSIVNAGGEDFIAYCFAGVEGFSKVGTYKGNGSTTGTPFIYLGFKPKFILFKGIDSNSRQWNLMNSERIPYNGTYARTVAESNLSESAMADSAAAIDILSNGFKVLANSSATNASAETYMYYAVAEHPFGGDGVSPATAR